MEERTLNVVAPNIKSGGGRELLEYFLEYVEVNYQNIKVVVFLDISLQHIKVTNNRKVIHLKTTFEKISFFAKKLDNALYIGNLPPLVKSENSMVYFHNLYLLTPLNVLIKSSIRLAIKFAIQQIYINFFIKNVDVVAVQNEYIKNSFIRKYRYSKVELLPFFRLCDKNKKNVDCKIYDFCYISLAAPHKNHGKLLDAVQILSEKKISIRLALTVECKHNNLIRKIDKINEKGVVCIDNLGVLPKEEVCNIYAQSKCLIFPSTKESYGLPLIEGVSLGIDAITPDLDYVYRIIKPSLVFDPTDAEDIASKMEYYLSGNAGKSVAIASNKIEKLIKFFNNGYR